MENIIIPMVYNYKGSCNTYLCLTKDPVNESITITTEYGETVSVVSSGHGLTLVLDDLDSGKYA